jgi:hypothetical protein
MVTSGKEEILLQFWTLWLTSDGEIPTTNVANVVKYKEKFNFIIKMVTGKIIV